MNYIQKYLERIIIEHKTGRAREHSYRPAMKELLQNINSNILATNEPAREKCGAPYLNDKKIKPK